MPFRETHGRRGQATEYYTWTIRRPEVFVQRVGTRWLLGVTLSDKTTQLLAYFDDLEAARQAGKRLTRLYAEVEFYTGEEEGTLARNFGRQLDARRGPSLSPIVPGP
jgi:hypothetical protein